jgi:hypothetical protein
MKKLHKGPLGGHFATEIMQRKILDFGYWWSIMYRDVHDYYKSCDAYQRIRGLPTQSFANYSQVFQMNHFLNRIYFVKSIKPT